LVGAARHRAGPALVALCVWATVLSSCSLGGPGHYQLIAYFTKTVSLYRSADVRVLGLKVGTVSSVQAKGDQVEVKLSINNGAVLAAGVRAARGSRDTSRSGRQSRSTPRHGRSRQGRYRRRARG